MARQDHAPWRDEALLRRKYVEDGESTHTIADDFGCSNSTVWSWLKEFGIETREQRREWPPSIHLQRGYEVLESEGCAIRVSQLLAIAEGADPRAVFDGSHVVHHADPEGRGRPGIPWDNRPGIIEVLTRGDHVAGHNTDQNGTKPWHDEARLRELYVEAGLTQEDIAERLGCSKKTISNWLQRFDIPTR